MIKVYSNCPEVELFVNGRSAGRKKRVSADFPAAGLRWLVRLRDGQNELRAVGQQGGVEVTDKIALTYQTARWDKPARLVLEAGKTEDDLVTLQVRCLDRKGVLCLDARNPVRFGLTGDGRLLDNLGTSMGARQVELYNGRAFISARLAGGVSVVSVSSKNLPTALLTLGPRRRA